MFQGLNKLRGMSLSQDSVIVEAPKHNKQYNVQGNKYSNLITIQRYIIYKLNPVSRELFLSSIYD